jgi:hypothetical protein
MRPDGTVSECAPLQPQELDNTFRAPFGGAVQRASPYRFHHIDFVTGQIYQAGQFSWTQFGFRTIAGVYFAILFAIRGFGITAGTHAFYDIIATIINAAFFSSTN